MNPFVKCLPREPDAGNLHVRFDEGEGGQRSKACACQPWPPLYSTGSSLRFHEPLHGLVEIAFEEPILGINDPQSSFLTGIAVGL